MALLLDMRVVPSCLFIGTTLVTNGVVLDTDELLVGTVQAVVSATDNTILWSNGIKSSSVREGSARRLENSTSALIGKQVQAVGAGPAFRGLCVAAYDLEIGSTGNGGSLTPVLQIRTANGLTVIWPAASVVAV